MRFVPQQNEGARLLCMWCVLVTSDACCLLLTEEIASKKIQRPIDSVQVKFGQVHCHFWSWSQSLVFCQVFLYEQRAAYCCNHFWFAICTSGTILRLTVARRPHSSATANLVRQNQSHRWRIQITRYSWIATSMILRAGCFRDFESEQEYEWNHESNLDSLLQEHGVESQINKQIRTCRFAGLHGDASTPYVACEATTTAADPVRRTTQPATCVRIPGDFFFKRWSTLCLDTWGRCVFFSFLFRYTVDLIDYYHGCDCLYMVSNYTNNSYDLQYYLYFSLCHYSLPILTHIIHSACLLLRNETSRQEVRIQSLLIIT